MTGIRGGPLLDQHRRQPPRRVGPTHGHRVLKVRGKGDKTGSAAGSRCTACPPGPVDRFVRRQRPSPQVDGSYNIVRHAERRHRPGLDGEPGTISVVTRRVKDRGWWSVRVDLAGGGNAGDLWPRPGRLFAASSTQTYHAFAEAIDDAFARWDRSHLHEFTLPKLGKTVTEFR